MIKTLQKKFIKTAMIAISVLLAVLFLSLNIFNIVTVNIRQNGVIDMLIDKEPFNERSFNRGGLFRAPINENLKFSYAYFDILLDSDENIIFIDVSRIGSVDEEEAKELLSNIDILNGSSGFIDGYKYLINTSDFGTRILFLDFTESKYEIINVIEISALMICICWILMFLFVTLLSKKAIRPIAENLDKQKQFVTDAGHEIKTPLAIIMANTEALELFNGGESKWSKNIKEQVNRLNGLMQNLLTLSKADEDNQIIMENINFGEITKNTSEMFYESAKLKDIGIIEDIDDINVYGNKEQMVNLVSILIDNALKYGVNNNDIKISLHKSDNKAILTVTNKCEKLPDIEPERLFDRFYRADTSRSQGIKGYGIGLAAASAICELHKGSISAKYGDENEISFIVKL